MDLLNLDDILKVNRQITIGGVSYDVVEQSVEQMIIALQVQKKIDKNEKPDDEEIMTQVIESVSAIIPSCPKDVIKRLPMRAIYAIFEFVNASDKEVINNSTVENQPESESETGKK